MTDTLKKQDKQIKNLRLLLDTKKLEVAKAEKPIWVTNGTFRYGSGSEGSFDIRTTGDINTMVTALAMLISRKLTYETACEELGVDGEFYWYGHSIEDWKKDLKSRIAKIQLKDTKRELAVIEKELNNLTSEELKRQYKLDNIATKLA